MADPTGREDEFEIAAYLTTLDLDCINYRQFAKIFGVRPGDNGEFFIGESAVRALGIPSIEDMDDDPAFTGLTEEERDALLDFKEDCEQALPCAIEDLWDWRARTGTPMWRDAYKAVASAIAQRAALRANSDAPDAPLMVAPARHAVEPEASAPGSNGRGPGRPAKVPKEAIEEARQLMREGFNQKQAILEAMGKHPNEGDPYTFDALKKALHREDAQEPIKKR